MKQNVNGGETCRAATDSVLLGGTGCSADGENQYASQIEEAKKDPKVNCCGTESLGVAPPLLSLA